MDKKLLGTNAKSRTISYLSALSNKMFMFFKRKLVFRMRWMFDCLPRWFALMNDAWLSAHKVGLFFGYNQYGATAHASIFHAALAIVYFK